MTLISEKRDVQDALINYLIGCGWTYLTPDDVNARRADNERQPFLHDVLYHQFFVLNPEATSEDRFKELNRNLRLIHTNLGGNENYLKALRGQWTIFDDRADRERNLVLIDYERPSANIYQFTQELTFNDLGRRRMDMVLWINGLPVVVIENKSPTVPDAHLAAFDQVQGLYTDEIPEFIKYPPLLVMGNARLHYAPTWNPDEKAINRWKVNGRDHRLEELASTFLAPEHLLSVLRDHVIFYRANDQTLKFIMRPHQIRATRKIVERVLTADARSGLHWHTQGSGKTLTMIVSAHQLRRELSSHGENPTLLIVVDRLELESQMVQNLEAFGFPAVVRAQSRSHLRQLLKDDYRGLIVTLIHKFDRIPKDINIREGIVILIDEAHRSQEGDLGTYMRAALPNAYYFGFTGTPIDSGLVGRGTFETFGKDDAPQGYQDKYSMAESIEDKTTVPLYYTLAPGELQVDRETLDKEFFDAVDGAGIASIEALNALLDRLEKLKAVLKADQRVDTIAQHIADHYVKNVEPMGLKAFVVAVDREACALYKQALDAYLPSNYSRVVYTPNPKKDTPLMKQNYISDEEEKRIRRLFRDPGELPKILIVTQKLLTGFDAPVLYCMYLDKPMKDHTLLQAIARVNRPYPDKESGLVVDYIGIFENLQKALSFDRENVETGLIDLEKLKESFTGLLLSAQSMLAPIDLSDKPGRTERIIDHFFDQDVREAFVKVFKELQMAYEIISPDPFLRDYLDDYALITQVYQVVWNYFDPEAEKRRAERNLLAKTDHLIRDTVSIVGELGELPLYEINRGLAANIKADNVSERVKVTNLYRSLIVHIEEHQNEQPYLVSIADEVEKVVQNLRDRLISVESALAELQDKADQALQAREEQEASDMESAEFALFWVMKGQRVKDVEGTARQAQAIVDGHPGWQYNSKQEAAVRRELYKIVKLQTTAVREGESPARAMREVVDNLLRMSRMVGS